MYLVQKKYFYVNSYLRLLLPNPTLTWNQFLKCILKFITWSYYNVVCHIITILVFEKNIYNRMNSKNINIRQQRPTDRFCKIKP